MKTKNHTLILIFIISKINYYYSEQIYLTNQISYFKTLGSSSYSSLYGYLFYLLDSIDLSRLII